MKTEEKVKEEEYQRVAEGSEGCIEIRTNGGEQARCPFRDSFESVIARIGQQARAKVLSQKERLKQRLIPA